MHRQFFIKISQNRDYIQTHCNDRRNPFHFHAANVIHIIIHKLCYSIITRIYIQILIYTSYICMNTFF